MADAPRASSSPPEHAYYVYGVVPAGRGPAPEGASGVDPRFPPRILEHGGIGAVVSEVSLDEFGEDALHDNVTRLPWLEAKVRAHEAVLELLLPDGVVPMRFSTIYRSEAHVTDMLERERGVLLRALEHVRGKREWGVRGVYATDALAASIEESDEQVRELRDEVEREPAGRAYLARKRLEQRVREESDRIAAACARESHELLRAAAVEARTNALPPEDAGEQRVFLNGVYLVREPDEAAFREVLAGLSSRYGALGIGFELTGPWPAYNFVGGRDA
jgi:Gas vesicle synthesis protein GvpL/GvpF